jgi:RHS repeat-associated protein
LLREARSESTVTISNLPPAALGDLVSQRRSGDSQWFLFDALGSTDRLTDSAGDTTDNYTYEAYGEVVASTGTTENPYRYVGQLGYYDNGDGSLYVRARHYRPTTARWLSVDPIPTEPRYVYAAAVPTTQVDPMGTTCSPPGKWVFTIEKVNGGWGKPGSHIPQNCDTTTYSGSVAIYIGGSAGGTIKDCNCWKNVYYNKTWWGKWWQCMAGKPTTTTFTVGGSGCAGPRTVTVKGRRPNYWRYDGTWRCCDTMYGVHIHCVNKLTGHRYDETWHETIATNCKPSAVGSWS